MSARRNIETVRQVYAAMAEGNPAAAMALFHDEIVLIEPESLPYGGTYKGLGEIGAGMGAVAQYVDLAGLEVGRVLADNETAVAYVSGTWHHDDGRTQPLHLRECYTFRGDKIVEIRVFYWDVAQLVQT